MCLDFIFQKSIYTNNNIRLLFNKQKMNTLKMLSFVSVALLLAWCSTNKINVTDEATNELNTWEIVTETTDSGTVVTNDETISWTQTAIESWESISVTNQENNTIDTSGWIANNTNTWWTAEENALKAKIRTLIDERKIEDKPATKLTEEDIQLMEDILKEIVETTK